MQKLNMHNWRVKYAHKNDMRYKRVKYAFIKMHDTHMHNKNITKQWEI